MLTPRKRAGLELQAGLLMHVFMGSEQRPRRPVELAELTDIPELAGGPGRRASRKLVEAPLPRAARLGAADGNRPMTGMVDVEREGLDDAELRRWVEQAAAGAHSLPPKAKT